MVKRILFLMSDTGGGHRAAAEAIREALFERYGEDSFEVTLVDGYREMRYPLNTMPEFYPWIIGKSKFSWWLGYNISNTHHLAGFFSRWMTLTNGRRLRSMIRRHPADVVVSVHSVLTRPSMTALNSLEERPPFVTVVTDLVSTHMFWYDARSERCLVPTQAAYDRGIRCGLRPDQLRITGLPVHPRFTRSVQDITVARQELGWDLTRPAIMMVGGGDGVGPLYKTLRAINDRNLNCQLVIVTGKNAALKAKLEAETWNQPTHIYGFVTAMPRLMSAASILVTKAGPATISEAAIAGLPMIINDFIPGQEDGNIRHVIENNAGVYAPSPALVTEAIEQWLAEGEAGLLQRSDNARRLARPDAVWEIADEIWRYAHHGKITTQQPSRVSNLLKAPRRIFQALI